MFYSLEAIEKLRKEKLDIVEKVYSVRNLDAVYNLQSNLSSMSITIRSDAANAIMPALPLDGVGESVWNAISCRLGSLEFAAVPSASTIKASYQRAFDEFQRDKKSNVIYLDQKPDKGSNLNISLPSFLAVLAAQAVAVPVFLSICGVLTPVLITATIANSGCVGYELYYFLDKRNKPVKTVKKAACVDVDYQMVYDDAIARTRQKNIDAVNQWFNNLRQVTEEEINKELGGNIG